MSRRHLESYPTHPMSPPPNSSPGRKSLVVEKWTRTGCSAGDCTCFTLTSDAGFSGNLPNSDGSESSQSLNARTLFTSSNISTYSNAFYDMKSQWPQFPQGTQVNIWDVSGSIPTNSNVQLTLRLPMSIVVWWAGGAFQQRYYYQHDTLPTFTVSFKTSSPGDPQEFRAVTSPMQDYTVRGNSNGTILRIRQQIALDLELAILSNGGSRITSRNIRLLYFGIAGKFDPT